MLLQCSIDPQFTFDNLAFLDDLHVHAPYDLSIAGQPATTPMNCQRYRTSNMESGFRSCLGKIVIKTIESRRLAVQTKKNS